MFAAGLDRCGLDEKVVFGKAGLKHGNVRHRGMAGGDGAGLVQHNGIDVVQILQRLGALDEYAELGGLAGADHDGHGRGQTQRAGAGDDQHGDGVGEGELEAVAGDHPDDGGHKRDAHDHGHEHAADLVGKAGDGRFGGAGVVHEADDLRERGIVAHARGAEAEGTVFVDGGGDDRVANMLFHGDALAGDGGLIDVAKALDDLAVHGDALAGPDDHDVAGDHLLGGHGDFHAVAHDHGGLGREIDQLAQRVRSL